MKRFNLLAASIILLVVTAQAQTSSVTTSQIPVHFESKDNPTLVTITSPESLVEKSRGFARVEGTSIRIEGTVQDQDGVKMMTINNSLIQVAMNGSFGHTIAIKPGENIINIAVTDGKNNVHNEVRTVKSEAAIAKTTFDAALGSEVGTYYALIIGVNDYLDPEIVDLDNPISDASALKKVLQEQYIFESKNIDYIENATRAQINDAMDALARKVKPNDNVLIFYAGHGYWDEQAEIGYWIPADGKKRSTADWYRNSTLTDQLSAIKSKHTLLIADACFSGGIFKARAAFMDASLAINKKYELASRKAMTSGTLTEVPDRSAFLKYLVRRLEANTQKYLSVSTLFYSFEEAVINNSDVRPQYGTIQKVGDEGGEFIFIRKD
ncbi:MAG: caspase family protein [Cyclobacteriaceae bacterium]|nr:caspase family protein [Cyclobacteriaceae bacterium SS2]